MTLFSALRIEGVSPFPSQTLLVDDEIEGGEAAQMSTSSVGVGLLKALLSVPVAPIDQETKVLHIKRFPIEEQ